MSAMRLQSRCTMMVALFIVSSTSGFADQKSLADVARQEAARRKDVKAPTKVYTNDDLRGAGGATSPTEVAKPAPSAPTAQPAPAAAPPAEKQAEDPKKDRKYWQDRMAAARAELDRSKVYLDALQSRINALSTDFVNRDDPAQRALIEQDRKRAIAELERLKTQILLMTKGIADIEEEARRLGVPPGWLR